MKAADRHPLWTIKATAERLGVSSSSVDRLAQRGELEKIHHADIRRVVITAESIDAYEERVLARARRLAVIEGAVA